MNAIAEFLLALTSGLIAIILIVLASGGVGDQISVITQQQQQVETQSLETSIERAAGIAPGSLEYEPGINNYSIIDEEDFLAAQIEGSSYIIEPTIEQDFMLTNEITKPYFIQSNWEEGLGAEEGEFSNYMESGEGDQMSGNQEDSWEVTGFNAEGNNNMQSLNLDLSEDPRKDNIEFSQDHWFVDGEVVFPGGFAPNCGGTKSLGFEGNKWKCLE